jgi:hypothetical protein
MNHVRSPSLALVIGFSLAIGARAWNTAGGLDVVDANGGRL